MAEVVDIQGQSRFVFFSELQGLKVRSAEGHDLGRLADLIVITGELYPPVESLVVRSFRGTKLRLLWASVAEYTRDAIQLSPSAVAEPLSDVGPRDRLRLADDILDRQIVDVEGAKLERVNDLHFLDVKGILRLTNVDVGFRGLVRRMGWERWVDGTVRSVYPRSIYLKADLLRSWKWIQPLGEASGHMRLDVAQRQLAELHPADLAEIMEELDREQRVTLFARMDTETAAETLEEVSPEVSTQLINEVSPQIAADILEEMDPDEAADVLSELPEETQTELLGQMDSPEAQEVQELMQYDPRSAGGLMPPDVLTFAGQVSVGQALSEIRRRGDELPRIYEVFVIDEARKLRGQATLRDLMVAEPDLALANVMQDVPGTVGVDARLKEVAELASKYKVFAVPVVEPSGELMGMVTVDDILTRVIDGA